jgi:chromosome segregation protein
MRFTRLRVLGFKSFVEPSEFHIETGLTGVVGPNGCGKSNLVEAIRWVMGENSYKNMRASGMDDVIFSGSGQRPARNTAEVGLYLDNSDRTAPAAFNDQDEIQVTRRIEREAGSVYRINGREARAKDVQLLFADASTGARSPSMVGQGRIGELIQAKPQARRQLLEEAAGISGLHARRHEAELRLRAAETNLERLDDIIGQLESQIESLKRQARQANRFKALSADIRQSEATLLDARWRQARDVETAEAAALAAATNAVAAQAQAQMHAAKDQAVGAHRLPELRNGDAQAAALLQRLQIARTQLDQDAERVTRRQDETRRRLDQLSRDISRQEQMDGDSAETLARLEAEAAGLDAQGEGSDDRVAEMEARLEAASERLAAAEDELAAANSERARVGAERAQAEQRRRELTERHDRLLRQRADADAALDALAEERGALPDPLERRVALEEAALALEDCAAEIAALEELLDEARAQELDRRKPLELARTRLAEIEAEARVIAALMQQGGQGSDQAPVLDALSVVRGYETALGAALGDDLEQSDDAGAPVHWRMVAGGPDDPSLPQGCEALSDFVTGPAVLHRRIAQIGVVEVERAGDLQKRLAVGQRLVSREGGLWRWDGYVASADAPSPSAVRLSQANRLDELKDLAKQAADDAQACQAAHAAAEAAINSRSEALRHARETHRATTHQWDTARQLLARAEKQTADIEGREAVLLQAGRHVAEQLIEADEALAAALDAMARAPDPSHLDSRCGRLNADAAQCRAALADLAAQNEGLRREDAMRRQRLAAIEAETEAWRRRIANADTHLADLKARHAAEAAQLEALADAPEDIGTKRLALIAELGRAETQRKQSSDQLARAETAQRELDRKAAAALSALAEARETRGRTEERLHAARERRNEIELRIRDVLNCPPHEVWRLTGLPIDAVLPDIAATERRLENLKADRERLGAVNLRAEEESRELGERLTAILSDRDDVIEAIRKLRLAIQSLNREGRERLVAAFDVVNGQFQRLFTHLFGGGTAELQFVESDDPLDAGLEILARPPGKKPQTMTLLSGGEQALTAMALIFAVFLTNPAPICVLDEVDAPLDDHNVERFCNLMDEMARTTETRFVIITHNPITMARMDRLFGVTMVEQGVSQLVSVDLQTAEQLRDAG